MLLVEYQIENCDDCEWRHMLNCSEDPEISSGICKCEIPPCANPTHNPTNVEFVDIPYGIIPQLHANNYQLELVSDYVCSPDLQEMLRVLRVKGKTIKNARIIPRIPEVEN